MSDIRTHIDAAGVATLTLDRPELHNAFNEQVIADLTVSLAQLGAREEVRAVLLRAEGASFCAGADLDWMRRMAGQGDAANRADAQALAHLFHTLDTLPKPTIAVVQGPAYGGGVGLVACCDMAVASYSATFCLSEVRLGLIPATIGPYVVAAIGARACRRYFLTAERFTASTAQSLGLVQEVVAAASLDATVAKLVKRLLDGAPQAQAAAKVLIRDCADRPLDQALIDDTAERIARIRATAPAREGLSAFLEKRKAAWVP